jgi:hypothetical protein
MNFQGITIICILKRGELYFALSSNPQKWLSKSQSVKNGIGQIGTGFQTNVGAAESCQDLFARVKKGEDIVSATSA